MPTASVTLTFTTRINRSVQVGDIIYYTPWDYQAGQRQANNGYGGLNKMGPATAITRNGYSGGTIVVDHDTTIPVPTTSSFIFFSKDNCANMSSIQGYYAEMKFVNKSTDPIEIFSVGTDMFESSK